MDDRVATASEKKKAKRRAGRKAGGAVLAFTAAVGVFFSSLFGAPGDLLADPQQAEPPAIVMESDSSSEGTEQEREDEKKYRPGFFARLRGAILSLPLYLRVGLGLPLWAFGWLVTQAFSALWKTFLAPVAGSILTFVIMALVLLAVTTILLKTVFPELTFKEILSRPNILTVLIACAVFCLFNIVMGRLDQDFARLEWLIRFAEGAFILILILLLTAARKHRHAAA